MNMKKVEMKILKFVFHLEVCLLAFKVMITVWLFCGWL